MNRNGGVIALTVVGVLVAGGAAAALNTLVLHSSTQGSVASAEQFLTSGRSSTDQGSGATPSATAAPVVTEDSVTVSDSPSPAASRLASTDDRHASTPQATRTSTRRATVARVSPTTASPSESHSESHSGSGDSGGGSDD